MPVILLVNDSSKIVDDAIIAEISEVSRAGYTPIESETAGIGWRWDGETFIAPRPFPDPVPVRVTNAQMRCALRDAGLLASIKQKAADDRAAHNAINPTDDGEFWERWEYGNEFGRQDAFVLQMQAASTKTDAEIDDLFRLAATK